MNYAILGTSELCKMYAKAIVSAGDTAYAVCSRDLSRAEAFAKGTMKTFCNLEELLMDNAIDVVYICLPNKYHTKVSQECLLAGKHVLCEKPVTVTSKEYSELCALADEKGIKYAEAVMNFYSPLMPVLRSELKQEEVVLVRLDYCQRSRKLDLVRAGGKAPTFDKEMLGGALFDLGVYPIHFAVNLFGEPSEVTAFGTMLGDIDITDTIILRYDGFDAVITVSKAGQGSIGSEIICNGATYTLDNISVVYEATKRSDKEVMPLITGEVMPVPKPNDYFSAMVKFYGQVIKSFSNWALRENEQEYLTLRRNSLISQKILEEAHQQIWRQYP